MRSKYLVLLLVVLSAISMGITAYTRIAHPDATVIGYVLGALFLTAAIVVGNRK